MDFDLAPELALLQETARAFAQDRLRPHEREHERARRPGDAVLRLHRETGLAGLELPESLGGAGLGALARVLVNEELAAADPGAAVALDPLGPAVAALRAIGGEEALRGFALPLLARPEARAAVLVDTRPRLRVAEGRARGRWPWAPADRVDLLVVLERERVYVLRDGVTATPLRGAGLRAAGASELSVDGAIAAEIVSTPRARRALAHARLWAASLLVGTARAAAERSRAYALERVAFGRPIAHHQALAFLIADMASAVEAARLATWDAALRLDAAPDDDGLGAQRADEMAACAFLEAAEAAAFVTPNGVQILGGHGFMQDHPLEKWMREAKALSLLFGGVDLAREDAGRALAAADEPLALVAPAPGPAGAGEAPR